jgi:hypothetical protein
MMKVKSVTFGFTKNLGNYQSARAEVTVEIDETDTFDEAVLLAAAIVRDSLGIPLRDGEIDILTHYRGIEEERTK